MIRHGVMAVPLGRIRDLREDHDKTQKEIAAYLKVAQNTYSNYENGMREMPLELWIALSRYYEVNLEYLLGLTDVPEPLPVSARVQ